MHESELRRGRLGELGLGRRAENEARAEVGKGRPNVARGVVELCRKEGRKECEV